MNKGKKYTDLKEHHLWQSFSLSVIEEYEHKSEDMIKELSKIEKNILTKIDDYKYQQVMKTLQSYTINV